MHMTYEMETAIFSANQPTHPRNPQTISIHINTTGTLLNGWGVNEHLYITGIYIEIIN